MKVVYGDIFLRHSRPGHPENRGRLSLLVPELSDVIKPRNGEKYLSLCHSEGYISRVRGLQGQGMLTPDTYYNEHTFRAACYAAGASVQAARENAFALVRPPGHHAFTGHGGGFCIFNNMAVAAKFLSSRGEKVAVLDIDVHHGNGTQSIVQGDENVLYCSLHQSLFYPGTGLRSEGNAVNVPLPAGSGDEEGLSALRKRIVPAVEKFGPDYLGVSAGFDAYYKDKQFSLGNNMNFTLGFYQRVKEVVGEYNHFLVLEGGYSPEAVRECARVFIG